MRSIHARNGTNAMRQSCNHPRASTCTSNTCFTFRKNL